MLSTVKISPPKDKLCHTGKLYSLTKNLYYSFFKPPFRWIRPHLERGFFMGDIYPHILPISEITPLKIVRGYYDPTLYTVIRIIVYDNKCITVIF